MGMCFNCDRQLMFYDLKRVSIRLAQLNTEGETLMADFSISATSVADFYFILFFLRRLKLPQNYTFWVTNLSYSSYFHVSS